MVYSGTRLVLCGACLPAYRACGEQRDASQCTHGRQQANKTRTSPPPEPLHAQTTHSIRNTTQRPSPLFANLKRTTTIQPFCLFSTTVRSFNDDLYLVPRLSRQGSRQAQQHPVRRPQRLPRFLLRLHPPLPRAPRRRLRVVSSGADPLARVRIQAGQKPPRRPGRGLQEVQESLQAETHDRQNVPGEVLQGENLRAGYVDAEWNTT